MSSFQEMPPPTPPTPPTPPPAGADRPRRSPELRLDSVIVALGVAFLSAAVLLTGTRARDDGDLDLTVFLVGSVATIVLLGFGFLARASTPDVERARTLASWPVAFGIVGVGLMLGVLLDDGTSTSYIVGFVVIALAAAGYVATPGAPPVVAGIIGIFLVYGQAFTDLSDFDVAEDNGFKTFAFAVFLFVVIVTAIGWVLPPARTVVPVVVGVGAIVAYTGIFAAIAVTALFAGGFASLEEETPEPPSYDADVYTTFAFAALLVAGWVVLGYLTDAPGYQVIIVAMVATVFPSGLALLAVEHPTGWAIGAGLVGAAVLGVAGARSRPTPTGSPTGHTG